MASLRHSFGCVLLVTVLCLWPSDTVAQQEVPVLLFSADRNVPKPIQRRLQELFSQLGQVASDGRYRREARKQRLNPADEATIALLLPFEGATLGIFAESFRRDRSRYLRVRYFDGRSGQPLLKDEVPLEEGRLKPVYEYFLPARARRALESMGAMAPSATARARPGQPTRQPAPAPQAQPGETPEPAAAPQAYEPPAAWSEADAEAVEAETPLPILGWGSVGLGLSMQSSELPTDQGPAGVDGGISAGLDVALSAESTGALVRFGARLDYRSSIGYELSQTPTGGVERQSPARSHELLAAVFVRFRFTEQPRAASVAVGAGWMHQDFRVDLELETTTPYGAGGPKLDVALELPLGERAWLSLGPELGWLVALDDEAHAMGLEPGGPAFGGNLELFIRLAGHFGLRLHYRELALRLPTVHEAGAYSESRRFITLGGLVAY